MKRFENIIIATDLDGTFLGSGSRIVPENIEAVRYFKEQGGHFTFSTGRSAGALRRVFPQAWETANLCGVLTNGSVLYDFKSDTVYDEIFMPYDATVSLLHRCIDRFPHIGIRVGKGEQYLVPNLTPFLDNEISKYQSMTSFVTVDELPRQLNKFVCVAPPEELQRLKAYLDTLDQKEFAIFFSYPWLLEVCNVNATKGKRILKLKTLLSTPHPVIYAVGDYNNDIDMLQSADFAACPSNAVDEVKAICSIHLCHHDQGAIADLISKI
ncbi:MAG TPA: hypothetical protein DCY74_04355 [Clostridiales bacterium]|jgi:hypothetical protein|nr:hypothetical protein [Clostridiales bacterium]HBE13385.1 hypothetical protein [Clostridiales bacterium]